MLRQIGMGFLAGLLVLVAGGLAGCDLLDDLGDAGIVVLTDGGSVVAFDSDGASAIWDATLGAGAAGDVLVDGDVVFVISSQSTVVALDAADGTELWTASVDGTTRGRLEVLGDTLFVQTADDVVGLETGSGANVWTQSFDGLSGAMAAGDGALFVAGDPVRRLAPGSGDEEASYDMGDSYVPDIAVSGGRVIVGGRNEVVSLTTSLDEDWSYPLDNTYTSGLAVDSGDVYVATDAAGLLGFGATDPEPFMEAAVGEALDVPTVADGKIYVTISYGDLLRIDTSDGGEDWAWSTTNEHLGGVRAAGARVYLADGEALVGIDADSGTAEWEQSPGGTILAIDLI